jgi:malonyl-CoA/methylmalonyl-CoA synthetase
MARGAGCPTASGAIVSGNIFSAFAAAAERVPDRIFLEGSAAPATFADMLNLSARAAAALLDAGVAPGDRIVVQVEKSPMCVWLYLGCLRAGIIFVPLNTAYTPAEVAYFLDDADPAMVIGSAAALDALGVAGALPERARAWSMEADGSGSFADALSGTAPRQAIAACAPEEIAAILYTSGTTGRSKGAMLSHGNMLSNVESLTRLWQWQDDDVLLHALPIFHAHGLFVGLHCSLYRATTVMFRAKFDADAVVADLPRATVFMGVPTFYVRLLKHPGFDRARVSGTRLFISGSAPLTEPVFEAFAERTGQRILERYGMTEALMITSNPYVGERVAGTVGFALPDVQVRVDGGGDAPGVLEITGPNVFRGYWRMPAKTAEAFTEDGWFRTGDIATIDGEGRVRLVGRSSDLVISGGYNIYPKEIELLIDDLPGVEEAAVVGVPHADFGEAVVALVVARSGASVTADAISDAVRTQLAAFKRPKRVILLDELPRNAMGKVEKAALRRRYADLFVEA